MSKIEKLTTQQGYKIIKEKNYHTISNGDRIRYTINGEFRYGGIVTLNKFPLYIVLKNFSNKTWCVQLKELYLTIYVKKLETILKENRENKEIIEKYKKGKLIEKKV